MTEGLVSVIVPTYGGGKYISRTVDSVLNQTYPHVEVVVVDDNGVGTENQLKTEKEMLRYANDKRVKYVCHEVNINGAAARNTGVKNSDGEFIGLLDDDDIYHPDKIQKQVEMLKSLDESYGVTYCSNEVYRDDTKVSEAHVYKDGYVFGDIMQSAIQICTPSLLMRRTAYEGIGGFDETFRRHQDLEFMVRLTNKYKAKSMDFIGFRIYITNRNSARSYEQAREWMEHYLGAMEPYINQLPPKIRKDIHIYRRLDAMFNLLKEKRYAEYIKEYFKLHPGYRGIVSFYPKFAYHIKNKLGISQ